MNERVCGKQNDFSSHFCDGHTIPFCKPITKKEKIKIEKGGKSQIPAKINESEVKSETSSQAISCNPKRKDLKFKFSKLADTDDGIGVYDMKKSENKNEHQVDIVVDKIKKEKNDDKKTKDTSKLAQGDFFQVDITDVCESVSTQNSEEVEEIKMTIPKMTMDLTRTPSRVFITFRK